MIRVEMEKNSKPDNLIPKHGGYKKLKSFQLSRIVYDCTLRFCNKFISKFSRTHDQMVQAARSGVQNIAEGSQASGTSKKTELTLTNVARASLEELLCDYEDFIRQNNLVIWATTDRRRQEFVAIRCSTADEVALWVKTIHEESRESIAGVAANSIIIMIQVTCKLLDKQIAAQAEAFKHEGGFSERLYKFRKAHQNGR
jgi:four helix bundle suffix protein